MEWRHLPKNKRTCPKFGEWVQYFYDGGYFPFNPGERKFFYLGLKNSVKETMDKVADTERDQMIDIVWVHSSATSH